MKTLEEIKEHLSTTVYDEDSKQRIAGFLIGKEIGKEEGTLDIEFALPKSFEEFGEWFNDSSKDYFQRKDSIVNDGLVPDDILEKMFKVFFGEEEPKYKYVGEERNSLIKKKDALELIVKENDKFIKNCNDSDDLMFVKLLKEINDTHKVTLKGIENKLNETVD